MERQIAERLERLRVARDESRVSGGPRPVREKGPEVDATRTMDKVMRDRQAGTRPKGPAVTPADDPREG